MRFQFQSGTIKGGGPACIISYCCAFQFQSGTIKGDGKNSFKGAAEIFQFQSGTIKGFRQRVGRSACSFISIPIWYD